MDKIKNPFGLYKNKDIIYIKTGDYENSDKYKNCYCLECGDKLVPKMGKKNIWHFAHFSNKNCKTSFESGLHIYAKEVINKLPMEFAVEAQKLLAISLEGSVG